MEIINESWLEAIIELMEDPQVGIVGAKLLHPDNSIQHAGSYFQKTESLSKPFTELRTLQ